MPLPDASSREARVYALLKGQTLEQLTGQLAAGEFCFIPLGGHSLGAQLQSSSGTVVAEYAYFVKG